MVSQSSAKVPSEAELKRQQAALEQELKKLEIDKLKADIAEQKHLVRAAKIRADDEQMDLDARRRGKAIMDLREQRRLLYLTGEVDEEMAKYLRSDLLSWKYRDEIDGVEPAPVMILINSPGGYVISGLEIYDTIMEFRDAGWKIDTRCTGMAMSMAGILLQAGESREMTPRATFMLHEIAGIYFGKTSDVKTQVRYTESLQSHCSRILADRANVSFEEIEAMWENKDVFLTAEETLEKGFVDRINTNA